MKPFATTAAALLIAATSAAAQPTIETYNCGYQVVAVGHTVAKLTRACGTPSRVVQLETGFGGAAGERWEYYRADNSVVLFWISGAIVRRIERAR
jgi:hypothetical protein